MSDDSLIYEILVDMLGEPDKVSRNNQYGFSCPLCSQEKGLDRDFKGNLEVNTRKGVYHCWSCGEIAGTKGRIRKLVRKFGARRHLSQYDLLVTEDYETENEFDRPVTLPTEYESFDTCSKHTIPYKEAISYLRKRAITKKIIDKFSVGFTRKGKHSHRIIVPSYDEEGNINYFVARSFVNHKLKYKNPVAPKEKIIFNEHLIEWDKDIYLVEGVFDMFFLDNAIPLLGKNITDNLWSKLYDKSTKDIYICLDSDAWKDSIELYRKLDGGKLKNRIKLIKLPKNKDVCDIKGKITDDMIIKERELIIL